MVRTAPKKERVSLRIDAHSKRMLERAAGYAGSSLSDFVITRALAAANEVIQARETVTLSGRDWDAFLDALANPPAPDANLEHALPPCARRSSAVAIRASSASPAQDVRRKVARAFVAVDRAAEVIAGYHTLSAASFARQQLAGAIAKRLPHYPVPAAILGRLAIDHRYQGRGLGELMLADAIKRVLRASEALAVHAIVVDAKNTRAKAFYERYGFVAFSDAPNRLYLPLGTVLKARSGNRTIRLRP